MTGINRKNQLLHREKPDIYDEGTGIEPEITESVDQITEPFDPTLIRVPCK